MKKRWLGLLVLAATGMAGAWLLVRRPLVDPPPEPTMPPPAPAGGASADDLAAARARQVKLEQELAAARHELTELRKQTPAAPPAAEAPAPREPGQPARLIEAFASALESPDMQEMMNVQVRMQLDQTYGEFLGGMALNEEETNRLKDLLAARNLSVMSHGLKHLRGEGSGDDDVAGDVESYNARIRELLGDDGYALFERYEQTQPERMQVDQFKSRLPGDLALDWETQDRLIGALADARLSMPDISGVVEAADGAMAPTPEMFTRSVEYIDALNQRYLEEAAGILDPAQYEAFRQSVEQQAAMQRAGLRMAEAILGGGGEGQDAPEQ